MNVPPQLKNPKTFLITDPERCMHIDFSPQVLRAFDILHSIMNAPNALRSLFRPLVNDFITEYKIDGVSDQELDRVISDYLTNKGFSIIVTQLYCCHDPNHSSFMKVDYPHLPEKEVTDATKPILYLDQYLSVFDRGDKQCYFTITRLLHACAHMLTPGLDRLRRAKFKNLNYADTIVNVEYKTPIKLGPIRFDVGDVGACFEDLVLEGRVQTQGPQPFSSPLHLISLPHRNFPPTKSQGNYAKYSIDDVFITNFLDQIEQWKQTPSNPLPNFAIPKLQSNLLENHYQVLPAVQKYFGKGHSGGGKRKRESKKHLPSNKKPITTRSLGHSFGEDEDEEEEEPCNEQTSDFSGDRSFEEADEELWISREKLAERIEHPHMRD